MGSGRLDGVGATTPAAPPRALERHPLDPTWGVDRDTRCTRNGCNLYLTPHCHCDYHDGAHGCRWGNAEFVRRLTEGWRENAAHVAARKSVHALGGDPHKLHDWTVEQFLALPVRGDSNSDEGLFNSLVIVPQLSGGEDNDGIHDSGWRSMSYAAVRGGTPIMLMGSHSDVLHLDGMSGAAWHNDFEARYAREQGRPVPEPALVGNWQIDCLRTSRLLHLWPRNGSIRFGNSLSSVDVFCVEDGRERKR